MVLNFKVKLLIIFVIILSSINIIVANTNLSPQNNKKNTLKQNSSATQIVSSITLEGVGGYSSLGNISAEGLKTKNKVIGGAGVSYGLSFLPFLYSGIQLSYFSFANNITVKKDNDIKITTIKNLGAINVSLYNEISIYKNAKFNFFGIAGIGFAFNILEVEQKIPKIRNKLSKVDKKLESVLNNFKDNPSEGESRPNFSLAPNSVGQINAPNPSSLGTFGYNNWLQPLDSLFKNKTEGSLENNWFTTSYALEPSIFKEYNLKNSGTPDTVVDFNYNQFEFSAVAGDRERFICSTALSSATTTLLNSFFGEKTLKLNNYKEDKDFLFYPVNKFNDTLKVYLINPIYGIIGSYNQESKVLSCGYNFVSAVVSKDLAPKENDEESEGANNGNNEALADYLLSIKNKTLAFDIYTPETYYENSNTTQVVANFLYTAGFGVSYSFNSNWAIVVKALYNGTVNNTFNSIYIKNININPNYFTISSGIRFSF